MHHPSQAADLPQRSSANVHDAAEAEGIRRMFIALQGVLPLMPLLPIVMVVGMWGWVESALLYFWLTAAISVSALRFFLVRGFLAQPDSTNATTWANRVALTSLWDGLIWGTAGVLFFLPDSVPHQVLVVTMVVGIPAGSVFVTSYWPLVQYGFALPAVGMTAINLISVGSAASIGLGAGMLVYLVILGRIMHRARAVALEAIMLRFENFDLVEQLREQKAFAENANVAKSQFLAAASHDLRQPLHALALFTDALEERVSAPDEREVVLNIRRCVIALQELFQSLLDISQLDAGIVRPEIEHFELKPLIERLAGEFEPQASARGLGFVAEADDLIAHTDAALLHRILLNLISNAIRYTESGSINVTAHAIGGEILISVSDTGIGISANHHDEVFREFVQLHNPGRDRSKGLGLGLAIVRRLADLLDCRLELDSVPGEGSEFRLAVAIGEASQLRLPDQLVAPDTLSPLPGKTIVIVEDEAAVREGMRVLLEGWGCFVFAADSGNSARRLLDARSVRPDVIVADYRLSGDVTGDRVIAELQNIYGADIPGIIITGDLAPERLQEALASGYLLLHKPLRPGRLRALLTNLLTTTAADHAAN